jgi:NAD(P)-dependent dehydrogenase (short-subunit alcohol dehydrogenase family)
MMYPPDEDSLTRTNPDVLNKTFAVNTIGPLSLTQALLPNLLKSSNPRIGNMSSRVGSVGDNSTGGSYAYRASKAALNSISKSMAMDLMDKGIVVVIMHPGYVKTGMSPWDHGNPEAVEPEEAASKLWKVLMSKTIGETGRFWHREGQELPW